MTKQIHPGIRKSEQFMRSINRHSKYKNVRRRRTWWRAVNKQFYAAFGEEVQYD